MPYIMVMGSLSAQHLSKDEGATVYGLKSEERTTLVRDKEYKVTNRSQEEEYGRYRIWIQNMELNSQFGMQIATASEQDRTVRVTQKGLTLVVVNRLHGLFGFDVVSHSMAMTNANRELVSFSMYKKSSPSSHGHSHGHHSGHSHSHSSSHKGQATQKSGNVVQL